MTVNITELTLLFTILAFKEEESCAPGGVFHRRGEGVYQHRQLQLPHGHHRRHEHEPRRQVEKDGKLTRQLHSSRHFIWFYCLIN